MFQHHSLIWELYQHPRTTYCIPKSFAEDIKFAEVPNGLSAFSKVPALGWLQIVGFAGIVELNATWYSTEIRNWKDRIEGLRIYRRAESIWRESFVLQVPHGAATFHRQMLHELEQPAVASEDCIEEQQAFTLHGVAWKYSSIPALRVSIDQDRV